MVCNVVRSDTGEVGRISTIVKPLDVKQPLVLYESNNKTKRKFVSFKKGI